VTGSCGQKAQEEKIMTKIVVFWPLDDRGRVMYDRPDWRTNGLALPRASVPAAIVAPLFILRLYNFNVKSQEHLAIEATITTAIMELSRRDSSWSDFDMNSAQVL
jgi:hypothetical protein